MATAAADPDAGNVQGNQGPPSDAGPATPAPDGGSAVPDAGVAAAPPQPTLIDSANINTIWDATPDGKTILVSHQQVGPPGWTGDLTIERDGKAIVVATSGVEWAQYFTPDGSAFLFSINGTTQLARSDGTIVPNLSLGSSHDLIGRWLYYVQQPSGAPMQVFRLLAPDGERQLLATGSSPTADVFIEPSADGEAYAMCEFSAPTCTVFLPGAAGPITMPNRPYGVSFSPDDKWAISGCFMAGASGETRRFDCDLETVWPNFSQDGSTLVATIGGVASVMSMATGAITVLPSTVQGLNWAMPTPNGRRVIGYATDGGIVVTDASGASEWITLTSDPYWVRGAPDFPIGVSISADSRIIAANSRSKGAVELIDGVDGVQTVLQNGQQMLFATPVFEPAGGHGRAIFYEGPPGTTAEQQVIGNGDGSGDWVEISDYVGFARWTGHSILSWTSPTLRAPYDWFVTPATGQRTPLVSAVSTWFVTDSVDHPVLLYVPVSGGLYSLPVPQPAQQ